LGGAKPKLTLSQDDVQYIAKFPDRQDDIYLPHLELAMLQLARDCGVDACSAEVIEPAPNRYTLLVRRFDREAVPGGVARKGYVSAWSVMRLDQHPETRADIERLAVRQFTPAMHARSYVAFADHMMRWCLDPKRRLANMRELWRRIVFNTLIRNTDDHPHNHGLLCEDMAAGAWNLSPAFDLVAQRAAPAVPGLRMAYLYEVPNRVRDISKARLVSSASRKDLVKAAELHYGYAAAEAARHFDEVRALVRGTWRTQLLNAGMPADNADKYARALGADFGEVVA
jgi:serine/threonine-protein kinase HipA